MRLLRALERFLRRWLHHTRPFFASVDSHAVRAARHAKKDWRNLLVWGTGAGFLFTGVLLLWASTLELPDLASLQTRKIEQSVKIFDRTGTVLLYDLSENTQRTIIPLSAVSANIQHAIVAIEDPEFYTHKGVKPTAIARAVWTNFIQADLLTGQGGSTITQQVIKLSVLTTDKTITRKFKEWVLALKLEQALTKEQILELYLNQVPFGGKLYGVEEAAMTFFGKHASDISIPEAAYLAAVLPAPTRLSPYGSHLDQLEVRKNLVLDKMYQHGYITNEERDAAKAAQVAFVPPKDHSIAAPHFVFYVRQYLEDKYGEEMLERSGWRVTTTLDADLQGKAEEIVQRNALANVDKFNASNMAMTAIDPKTGHILVMVGSRNYFDTEIPGAYNVAVTKPGRQPGSSFKPIVYAEAFSKGYTPDTVVFDLRTQFSTNCSPYEFTSEGGCYAPVNYDNEYPGPISLRNALAQSRNIPAVKMLYLAGMRDSLRRAKALGITTLTDPDRYGLTLVLGGGEVTLLEMTSAYTAFANNGTRYEPLAVLKVEDPTGRIIEDNSEPRGSQVLDPTVAQQINDVLSDTAARAPLGLNNIASFPGRDVALKTGTTNDYRDAWIIGYTPNLVVGTWAGNNDNSEMERRVGGLIVSPAWAEFMRYTLGKLPNEPFSRPEFDYSSVKPALQGAWYIPGSDGQIHDILYWVNKDNPTGAPPSNPAADPQYRFWEAPVRIWAGSYVSPQQQGDAGVEPFTPPQPPTVVPTPAT